MTGHTHTAPLSENWWEDNTQVDLLPLIERNILAPYEMTSPGNELLSSALFEHTPGWGFPSYDENFTSVSHWTVWPNDEDKGDTDTRRIDAMQAGLGTLSDETRYLRLQVACFQRCWFEFAESAENLKRILSGIGEMEVNLDGCVSCEPPWSLLMAVLRHQRHHPAASALPYNWRFLSSDTEYDPLNAPRQELARAYITILSWWAMWGDLACLQQEVPSHKELAEQIYRWLGRPTKLKILYVEKVRMQLMGQAFPVTVREKEWFIDYSLRESLVNVFNDAIAEELDGKDDPLSKRIWPTDLCHHGFFRRVNHQLASIGAGQWVAKLPGKGNHRERILSLVANYAHALGAWLEKRCVEEALDTWPHCHDEIQTVYSLLRQMTPEKKWLVACFWKHLLRNQGGPPDRESGSFTLRAEALEL